MQIQQPTKTKKKKKKKKGAKTVLSFHLGIGMVVCAYRLDYPVTPEAEAGGSLKPRSLWQHIKTQFKTKQKTVLWEWFSNLNLQQTTYGFC
jgi:hypothetical protein